jgi:pyochelin biosynthesis protein PchC
MGGVCVLTEALGPWLRRFVSRPNATLRLVCLPHGGGGASAYLGWSELLPPEVELLAVQYPAREDRFGDPVPRDMSDLVGRLAGAVEPFLDRPYALFGHSMGATVAYELAQELRTRDLLQPVHLVPSGREAPHDEKGGDVHRRDDDGLYAELMRLGGTNPEIMRIPEMRAMVLAYVRADYRLIETYRPVDRPPLDCPITVFLGSHDPDLSRAEAARWRRATRARTSIQVFPGDHFYLVPQRATVVAALHRAVTEPPAPAGET